LNAGKVQAKNNSNALIWKILTPASYIYIMPFGTLLSMSKFYRKLPRGSGINLSVFTAEPSLTA